MRRHAAWLVTLPLVLAGIEAGHATANVLFGAGNSEIFESTAAGAGWLPLVAAALAAILVAALVGRAGGVWDSRRARFAATPFAVLPVIGFVSLELGESLSEGLDASFLRSGAFLGGLAFQLPVGVGAYFLARALLRLSDDLRAQLVGLAVIPTAPSETTVPRPSDSAQPVRTAPTTARGRAPPSPVIRTA